MKRGIGIISIFNGRNITPMNGKSIHFNVIIFIELLQGYSGRRGGEIGP
jgi:hypothetical protein